MLWLGSPSSLLSAGDAAGSCPISAAYTMSLQRQSQQATVPLLPTGEGDGLGESDSLKPSVLLASSQQSSVQMQQLS